MDMTREEFADWIGRQERTIRIYLDQGLLAEALEVTQEALEELNQAQDAALREGFREEWQERQSGLLDLHSRVLDLHRKVEDDDILEQEGTGSQEFSPQGLVSRGEALAEMGEYDKGLADLRKGYELGVKSYQVAFLILECLNKLGRLNEQLEFIQDVLDEADLREEERAKLYYRLGVIYLHLDKKPQARQALWEVRRIDPEFPGLQVRLKPLEEEKGKSQSRYDLLLRERKISKTDLDKALSEAMLHKEDPDQFLIREYGISKADLGQSLSDYFNVPFVAFDSAIEPPFELFEKKRLDPEHLKRGQWVPFAQEGKSIIILMSNPFDLDKLGEIKFLFETSNVQAYVSIAEDISQFVENFTRSLSADRELSALGEELDIDAGLDSSSEMYLEPDEEDITAADSEVVRLVSALLIEAWRKGASDIHIEPNPRNRYCMIRFREDGSCHEYRKIRLGLAKPIVSRIKIMAHLDIAERRLPQDGKVKIKLDHNRVIEYRVATLPTIEGQEDVVLRVLASGKPLPLERLGLLERNMVAFRDCIDRPYGMILSVGPTGSGKTTTLHSALSYINTPERKIWTAEDPVEISQEGLRQVQINPKIGLTFAATLRSFLRADPDVIMIGEMRDSETAHIGVEASLTGHMVFSTLHTNSAPETVTRLLDMKIDPFNFADSLICVLAQRLMKTLCAKCKESYTPSSEEMENLKREFGPTFEEKTADLLGSELAICRPVGCSQCNRGYKGRIGVHEMMLNTSAIKAMIKTRRPTEDIRDEAIRNGMLTLKQDGILKVLMGMTDIKQVRAVATG
jgi:type II secretory ATPase GspE/PulE/Tfp pilus assembly ATPase PilB-like protein/tetratricopeptide (TPR) repeat protein